MKAYAVACTFGSGAEARLYVTAVIAPSPQAAVGMWIDGLHRHGGIVGGLTGVAVEELTQGFLRDALAKDGQERESAQVLSLVRPEAPQPADG